MWEKLFDNFLKIIEWCWVSFERISQIEDAMGADTDRFLRFLTVQQNFVNYSGGVVVV